MATKEEEVTRAYREALGRDPDPGGLAAWQDSGLKYGQLVEQLKASEEGQRASASGVGQSSVAEEEVFVNPYGPDANEPATEDMVSDRVRPWYEVWRRYNPDEQLTLGQLRNFTDQRSQKSVEAYEAEFLGLISVEVVEREDGSTYEQRSISQAAADFAGGAKNIRYSGHEAGGIIFDYTEEGALLKHGQMQSQTRDDGTTFEYFLTTGKPREGLLESFGGDFINKILPNELKLAMDPLGLYGSALLDADYSWQANQSFAGTFGLKESEVATAQAVGKGIVQGMLTATGIGAAAAVAMEFASAANTATAYNTSMSDAFEDAGINSLTMVATAALTGGLQTASQAKAAQAAAAAGTAAPGLTVAQVGYNAAVGSGTAALSAGLKGEDVGEAALRGAASSTVSSAIRPTLNLAGLDSVSRWQLVAANSAASAGVASAFGASGEDIGWSIAKSLGSASLGRGSMTDKVNISGDTFGNMFDTERAGTLTRVPRLFDSRSYQSGRDPVLTRSVDPEFNADPLVAEATGRGVFSTRLSGGRPAGYFRTGGRETLDTLSLPYAPLRRAVGLGGDFVSASVNRLRPGK